MTCRGAAVLVAHEHTKFSRSSTCTKFSTCMRAVRYYVRTKFSRHRVAVSLNQQFWTELRKTEIRSSKIARSSLLLYAEKGNESLKSPRTLKYDLKPKGSRYMIETVENG